jgi:Arylsulfotransferase (ASST)
MFSGGTPDAPYDYFHINSIAVAPDGDLLVSGRNTWTIYKVTRPAGKIAWRLGGNRSDFKLGPGVEFYWQHHVRPHGATTLTLFDNGAAPQYERQSRALILRLDPVARSVRLVQAFMHPDPQLLVHAMGDAELLPDGGMFVGWGASPYYSEFAADGSLVMDAVLPLGHPSYRTFRRPWTGHPTERPAAAASAGSGGTTVYASWNGATSVASWGVLAGKQSSSLAYVGAARRTGFETAIAVASDGPYFAVEPHDASGHVLAQSATVRLVS